MNTVLRDLHTFDEYRQVVDLERAIWGYTDANDLVTLPVFIITMKRGGILVGAFDEDERMVGFVFSIVGMKHGRAMHWSHMLGVLPEYRSSGLGRELKLAQRERALAAGVDLVEWTFDPLQAINAHLNFTRLGVVSDEYCRNVYGESTSTLHRGTPTDRLIVQWNIREPHVERRLDPASAIHVRAPEVAAAPMINRTALVDGWLSATSFDLSIDAPRLWLEIPTTFSQLQQQAPELALEWRMGTRDAFETYLSGGYRVVDFVLDRGNARGRYLLTK
jgi:predicted GNAT superfamily acetyltransferase